MSHGSPSPPSHWIRSKRLWLLVALALLVVLFLLARRQVLTEGYGDARRGFVYQRVRNNMLMLERMPVHPKKKGTAEKTEEPES